MNSYVAKIEKEALKVIIYTVHEVIKGEIHGMPHSRMLDTLNKQSGKFIPVSNVEVYKKLNDKLLYKGPFLSVNTSQIVLVAEPS